MKRKSRKLLVRLYEQIWGSKRFRSTPEYEVRGLDAEMMRVTPHVLERVSKMDEITCATVATDLTLSALETEAKIDMASRHIDQLIGMYDNKTVSNKRAKIRQLLRELRGIVDSMTLIKEA